MNFWTAHFWTKGFWKEHFWTGIEDYSDGDEVWYQRTYREKYAKTPPKNQREEIRRVIEQVISPSEAVAPLPLEVREEVREVIRPYRADKRIDYDALMKAMEPVVRLLELRERQVAFEAREREIEEDDEEILLLI
jgi:hypothetical protein